MRVSAVALGLVIGALVMLGDAALAAGQATDADGAPAAAITHLDSASAPVRTEAGLLQGVAEGSLAVFRGVPFAASPAGPLRWRPPQPVTAWEGVRHADTFSPRCPQTGAYPPETPPGPMSEDCLYLNIWAPAHATGPLPVMVWVHGGGLTDGSASVPAYAGDQLATHGVVVVTVNYRLGALGFLAHPGLSHESPQHVSGNYGFLDQIAALQWVHRNIAAFGGDPQRVTVFGQSSGSIALSALSVSPLTEGLLQRAIGESGGLFEPLALDRGYSLPGAEAEGAAFAKRAGAASLDALRAMPVAGILKVAFDPHLIIDGYALKEAPYDAYARGAQHRIDLLIGYNVAEGAFFLGRRTVTARTYRAELSHDFSPLLVRLLAPGPSDNDMIAQARAAAFEGDMRFRWDMWTWGRLAARAGTGHVYVYEFAREPPFAPGSRYAGMGATHGMEMPYVFGHLEPAAAAWTDQDRQLSAAMQAYWTNFAASGNPNAASLPPWRGWPSPKEEVLRLDTRIGMEPIPDPGALRRIDRLYGTVRNIAAHPVASAVLGLATLGVVAAALTVARRRRRLQDLAG